MSQHVSTRPFVPRKIMERLLKSHEKHDHRIAKFITALSESRSVKFNWKRGILTTTHNGLFKDGPHAVNWKKLIAAAELQVTTKLDLVFFLRRNKINVEIVEHGKTPAEYAMIRESIEILVRNLS